MITVVLNPASKGAGETGISAEIVALFLAAGLEAHIVVLAKGQDPTAAARAASVGSSIVVAGGGDGTVSSVAVALVGTTVALGVLPLGTLNHFAKDLRIPMDLENAVATIAAGHVGNIDVGQVNGRVFINNSSIGLYPSIVEAREKLRREGHRKWPALVIATVRVLRRYRGVAVKIEMDGQHIVRRTPFVFVGNNQYAVTGIHLGGRTRVNEGKIYVYLAPRLRTRELPRLFVRALFGEVGAAGEFEIVPAEELWVETAGRHSVHVAIDGEVVTMAEPLHYLVRPGALKVLLPAA